MTEGGGRSRSGAAGPGEWAGSRRTTPLGHAPPRGLDSSPGAAETWRLQSTNSHLPVAPGRLPFRVGAGPARACRAGTRRL